MKTADVRSFNQALAFFEKRRRKHEAEPFDDWRTLASWGSQWFGQGLKKSFLRVEIVQINPDSTDEPIMMGVNYNGTFIVQYHVDGAITLDNGGYNTPTTRRYQEQYQDKLHVLHDELGHYVTRADGPRWFHDESLSPWRFDAHTPERRAALKAERLAAAQWQTAHAVYFNYRVTIASDGRIFSDLATQPIPKALRPRERSVRAKRTTVSQAWREFNKAFTQGK